ncbi:MAG: hypothetical protein KDB79_14360 [Acidobacteria bacterium]|nr:hypothetical protein [Acidobacteriota bacterium]
MEMSMPEMGNMDMSGQKDHKMLMIPRITGMLTPKQIKEMTVANSRFVLVIALNRTFGERIAILRRHRVSFRFSRGGVRIEVL